MRLHLGGADRVRDVLAEDAVNPYRGSGLDDRCGGCTGKGVVMVRNWTGLGTCDEERECERCGGTGSAIEVHRREVARLRDEGG